jgi:hypothetical protein
MENNPKPPSFFSRLGSAAAALAKHIVWRSFLWGTIGFVVGALGVCLSFVIGIYVMGRGSEILVFMIAIPVAIPFLGAAFFFTHGLQRGVARAALAWEKQFGLVPYVVGRVMTLLEAKVGSALKNVSVSEFESRLKEAVREYIKFDDIGEGKGFSAWIIRKVKGLIVKRLQSYLLIAYRAEEKAGGSENGFSLEALGERAKNQLSERLGKIVMSPLNKQLFIFMTLYLVIALGWWYWIFLLLRLF